VLGGGNVKQLDKLPPKCREGDNVNAFIGGIRLWEDAGRRAIVPSSAKPARKKPAKKSAAKTAGAAKKPRRLPKVVRPSRPKAR
jgi:hypothetical protein